MKTLIAIRNQPEGEATVRFGGLITGLQNGSVTLITVTGSDYPEERAGPRLEWARQLLDVPVAERLIRAGNPAEAILEEAEAEDYDLIVVGARTGLNLLNVVLGGPPVARTVVRSARASVLVVNQYRPALRKILIATSGQKLAVGVLPTGARLARAASAKTTILHVANPVPSMYTGLEAMDETLEELLQTDTPVAGHLRDAARFMAAENVETDLMLRHGVANDEILREARLGDYDLIIIGPGSTGVTLRTLFMENVTGQVISHAPCPVMVVR